MQNASCLIQSPEILLEAIHQAYYDRLVYFAWKIVRDQDLSKDLVQEAFVNYWNERDAVTVDAVKVRNFLYVNVKNACLKYLRHSKVRERYLEHQDPDPVEEETVLSHMIRAEVLGEIYAALETLPEGSRNISKMAYLEGLKNQEIADQLGISVNTVKTQKQRALQMLRMQLKPEHFLLLVCLFKNTN